LCLQIAFDATYDTLNTLLTNLFNYLLKHHTFKQITSKLANLLLLLTDIPLMGPINSESNTTLGSNFVIHWLNNKEFYYTLEAEKIAEEIVKQRSSEEERESSPDTVGAVSTGSGTSTPATAGSNGLSTVGSDPSMDSKKLIYLVIVPNW